MLRKSFFAVLAGLLLLITLTLIPVNKITALQSREQPNWQTSESVAGIRLSIREKDGVFESYNAVFVVIDSNGKEFRVTKRVENSMINYVQFPNDFGGYAPSGKYRWKCIVNDEVVVQGKFDYAHNYISIDDNALKFSSSNRK